ncbi:SDR family NAD(P)-dependent oxidoreductase [Enterococcus faecium]|uniref:SDR family NAD(P)-dependent oxidoreductase n=1 Tax=Enterococcus faecium TaxID=1352 RepID=UPI0002A22FFE|nr:SDR family NAD(P)-dependent oxidoreductase [Enterococcus faecium]ELB05492.1 hypothetical protein OIG_04373 [Enterococcus faecium EnGen0028]MDT6323797.1 SDR family NAD(P)-dependent oxidoreductase [Enterococcus faecium]
MKYLDEFDQGQILKLTLDVTNEDEIKTVVDETIKHFETIDILVNNAGLGYFGTFEESNIDQVKYMFDVNVWGLVNMTRSVLPQMRKKHSGVIVNFSSIGGLYSFPTLSFYHGTKYTVEGITESLAKEVENLGIKTMLVEPSGFRTDWAGRSSQKTLPRIDDYNEFANFINNNMNGAHHEPGDPDIAAEIIYDMITNNVANLPLRLPLGQIAVDTAIDKYEKELSHFKQLRHIAVSADKK